eukprot:gene4584-6774_t
MQDFSYDFNVDVQQLHSATQYCFILLDVDDDLMKFVTECYERYNCWKAFLVDLFSFYVMRAFMSPTTTNALCYRGRMHVLSLHQLRTLLRLPDHREHLGRLLDIGAGDGRVTYQISPFFRSVDVTETNRAMLWRLKQYPSWACHDCTSWQKTPYKFDVVTCLNVLDRCEKPWTLLKDIRQKIVSGGFLVIAVVFPFSPYIDDHGRAGRRPVEHLDIRRSTPERSINAFYKNVAERLGMSIVSIARVPYMCEGDMYRPFYVLDDYIFVLQTRIK